MVSMGIDNRFMLLIILIAINSFCLSQSIVINGSFEEYKKPMVYFGGIKPAKNWFAPNSGTPDLFNPKSNSFFNNKFNRFGIQSAQNGFVYSTIDFDCGTGFEYLSTLLKEELKYNSLYCVSFYLSLEEKSHFIMNGIGIDLSNEKPQVNRKEHDWNGDIALYKYEYYKGQNVVLLDTVINDKENWVYCSLIYRAKGGEKYLTIGNFVPYEHASFYNVQYLRKMKTVTFGYCGYYIDNVSMVEISDSSQCPCYKQKLSAQNYATSMLPYDSLPTGTPITLNNVLFETGSSSLLPESFPSLQELITYLKNNPVVKVEILGHTDNQGDSAMNMELSLERAEAVVEYLVSKGVERARLKATGYGSTKPIATNDTEDGRMKNRRVEFIIQKEK